MEGWELVARERIRETVARYAHLVDRGRLEEVLDLFTEDATLEAGDEPPAHGRDAIRALLTSAGSRLAAASTRRVVRHHVSNLAIDVTSPEAATATSYFLVLGEHGLDHWGRYRDQLVAADGRWRFRRRRVRVDGRPAGSWTGM